MTVKRSISKRPRVRRAALWWAAGSVAATVLAGCGATAGPDSGTAAQGQGGAGGQAGVIQNTPQAQDLRQANWHIQPYQATDQDGKPFNTDQMKGKIWLADVIYTNCPTMCPVMTPNMAQVQKKLKAAGASAEIVSFSCDPDTDKPEVLKKYAERYNADLKMWHFVTSPGFDITKDFVFKSFHTSLTKNPPEVSGGITMYNHTTQFFLINRNGQIVKMYDGMKPPIDQIVQDVKALE
ncbi:cytochrome c oxidase assembly protein [Kyrpidia spormannii]|uniref:Cytochrome c oxidase assembly protein n=1 Tax=Kyrpidia spormannii TaxID=2055160 RepID=A0A2K8N8Q0_9BACL|nr:cytochrome c oxidase assembly protein [Kyrpidia spormannii]